MLKIIKSKRKIEKSPQQEVHKDFWWDLEMRDRKILEKELNDLKKSPVIKSFMGNLDKMVEQGLFAISQEEKIRGLLIWFSLQWCSLEQIEQLLSKIEKLCINRDIKMFFETACDDCEEQESVRITLFSD